MEKCVLYDDMAGIGLKKASELGATYADIRFVDDDRLAVLVRNGKPEDISSTSGRGFGVRVIVNGAWGFSGSRNMTENEVRDAVDKAVKVARGSALRKKKDVRLAQVKTVDGKYSTTVQIDPFEHPLEDILDHLLAAEGTVKSQSKYIRTSSAQYEARREKKFIATSEGSRIQQTIVFCGGGVSGTAVRDGLVQVRSYPSFLQSSFSTAGYEYVKSLDLVGNAEWVGKEAEALLDAKPCPTEIKTSLILDDGQLGLQLHEVCGHPTELDRVLGTEIDMAGDSFMTPEKLGKLKYGSKHVNIVADATRPGEMGTFGYDDEGVPPKKVDLIKEGVFSGYQSSRETAAEIGLPESSGNMRAMTALNVPLVRMSNINLLPGDWKKDEIIEDTKEGILMRSTKMWSIDRMRLNFQFGTEAGWRIENGELKEMVRDPTYTGVTYEFWGSVDAVAKDGWYPWGTTSCGKGRPSQSMYVGHGCSSARFRNVRVGIIRSGP